MRHQLHLDEKKVCKVKKKERKPPVPFWHWGFSLSIQYVYF